MSDLVSQLVGALEDCLDDSHQVLAQIEQMYGMNYRQDRLEAQRKTIADAEAALSAAKDGGWRPIETAPKDGAVVWAYNGEQGRMRWTSGDMPGGSWALWVWDDQVLAEVDPAPYQPTHWQPLPNPPKEQNT